MHRDEHVPSVLAVHASARAGLWWCGVTSGHVLAAAQMIGRRFSSFLLWRVCAMPPVVLLALLAVVWRTLHTGCTAW
jgi:hypothetical protein